MKNMKRLIKNEEGQALPLAIVALTVGALLVGSFLSYTSTNLIASGNISSFIEEQYSADAGVEDAIWNLVYGDLVSTELPSSGDSYTYSLGEELNGQATEIVVTRGKATVARDTFESGGWAGGSGWLGSWTSTGNASIVTDNTPYEGTYHLLVSQNDGYAKREVDLSIGSADGLQFQAKASSFETGETARCLVSFNGTDWVEVQSWADGDDDNIYRLYEIDLTSYAPFSQLWIAFEANMGGNGDNLYVDDLRAITTLSDSATTLATEDFESGGWAGGSGWLYDWWHSGSSSITTADSPNTGSYHLMLRNSDGYVDRAIDLSGQSGLRLQFYAKVSGFERSDQAYCQVSPDDTNWTTVRTWTDSDDDSTYHFVDIDLSPYTMSSEFWIAFNCGMDHKNDFFYVDDISIVGGGSTDYEIVSSAGSMTTRSIVSVQDSTATINSWQTE